MGGWIPEREVDEALARLLIETQFPELRGSKLERAGAGWDNVLYRLLSEGESWLFRFPQRQIALEGVKLEMRVLGRLAARLPTPIPVPAFLGRSQGDYPWPFFGYRELPGVEACDADPSLEARHRLAPVLARFLRELHRPEVASGFEHDIPADPLGRLDFNKRVPMIHARVAAIREMGDPIDLSEVERIAERARNFRRLPASAVVHGDLHFRQFLLEHREGGDARLSGVIDWGDLHRNDPAVDLQIAWSFFPPIAREAFWSEYGTVSEDQKLQAQAFSAFLNTALLEHGLKAGLPAVTREARQAIRWLVIQNS